MRKNAKKKISLTDALVLVGSILLAESAGLLGSLFTTPAIPTWYAQLAKPSFSPPNEVFGPVWITLYALMGVSAFLLWRQRQRHNRADGALLFYLVHLIVNASWSIVFFGLQDLAGGLAVITILWLMILDLIRLAWPIDRRAALLLLPYLAWVTFATALNLEIWQLNG